MTDKKKLHTPTSSSSPVNLKSGDRLTENPSNDEKIISQKDQEKEKSATGRGNEPGRNQVTNEDEEKKIINPSDEDWEPENPEQPEPGKHPNEEIRDDPDEMQKKIPKM